MTRSSDDFMREPSQAAISHLSQWRARRAMSALIHAHLGITREEFLQRLDVGEYAGCQNGELLHLVTLAPFAR